MNDVMEKLSELAAQQREIITNQGNQQKLLETHSTLLQTQGETLLRNTITVEEHKRMSINLEKELKRVDGEVKTIRDHVTSVRAVGKAAKWVGGFLVGAAAIAGSLYAFFAK